MTAVRSWQPRTLPVVGRELADLFAQHRYVVLHFWAEWDGYDLQVDATLQTLRPEFEDRIEFRAADLTDDADKDMVKFAQDIGSIGVPALAFFIDGRIVESIIGLRPEAELRRAFTEWSKQTSSA